MIGATTSAALLVADKSTAFTKKLALQASLSSDLITRISGHSFQIGAAQDLLASDASMQWGGWSKSDTVMGYLEQFRSLE